MVIVAAGVLAGCRPSTGPDPADGRWYQWSRDAINVEFARFGPRIVDCAHRIAAGESGHWPFSEEPAPDPHHGLFQLHDGYWGSIKAVAARLGRTPNWHDPRQNAGAAAMGFDYYDSFRVGWAATKPPDCP